MTETETLAQRLNAIELKLSQVAADAAIQVAKLTDERDEYRKLLMHLREENERLKRGLLGQKAERLPRNDAQLSLAIMALAMGRGTDSSTTPTPTENAEAEQLIAAHARRKPVRKPQPDSLPRVTIQILPPEVEREGLDAFEKIGQDSREVLERRPASNVVVEVVYPRFVRRDRERNAETDILVAESVELPIERGSAGPGMLADSIVRRWDDHLPLHRLERIYGREGLGLARSTLCSWHMQMADLARPVVAAMFKDALGEPYLCVDATGVLVFAKEKCRNGHFWVMVAPEKHVLYQYSKHHDSAAVDALLPDYSGHLVADAHVVYDHLYVQKGGKVIEVACWAHVRRYWFKTLASDPERAKVGLTHIGALFAIERTISAASPKKRQEIRQSKSKPIVEAFFRYCDEQADCVLDGSPAADAIRYARNQREALMRFMEDGRLPMHNNISELNLRRQVVGRRNWLFIGSDDGGHTNTVFVSLLASCRMHNIEPLAYLRDLFCLLPRWPKARVLELAPLYWKKTSEQPEAQQLLAANVFRRVVLGELK